MRTCFPALGESGAHTASFTWEHSKRLYRELFCTVRKGAADKDPLRGLRVGRQRCTPSRPAPRWRWRARRRRWSCLRACARCSPRAASQRGRRATAPLMRRRQARPVWALAGHDVHFQTGERASAHAPLLATAPRRLPATCSHPAGGAKTGGACRWTSWW